MVNTTDCQGEKLSGNFYPKAMRCIYLFKMLLRFCFILPVKILCGRKDCSYTMDFSYVSPYQDLTPWVAYLQGEIVFPSV
jgi:hypothetical protein